MENLRHNDNTHFFGAVNGLASVARRSSVEVKLLYNEMAIAVRYRMDGRSTKVIDPSSNTCNNHS